MSGIQTGGNICQDIHKLYVLIYPSIYIENIDPLICLREK